MKKYLKNREGMALPMVLIIMMILTILAASLGTYASQSLRSVKYMNAQKQAYYLARAGVEAGVFAYQNAVTKTTSAYKDISKFTNGLTSFNDVDKVVAVVQNSDEKLTSNKVFLVYSSDASENAGTPWDGLKFATEADGVTSTSPGVIGYFTVEVAGAKQKTIVDEGEPVDKDVVEFRSTAVCFDDNGGEITRITSGYVYPARKVNPETCYGADGYLSKNDGDFDNVIPEKEIRYDRLPTGEGPWWQRLNNGLKQWLYDTGVAVGILPASEKIKVYEMIGGGDLILASPSDDVDEIKINENENNFYIFSTGGNIILEDTGLYVDPSKGCYATIGFYGKDIVIDGDITMGVYHLRTSGLLNATGSIVATLGDRYRLGTVMIGSGTSTGGDFKEYVSADKGGVTDENGDIIENANRIFFNGNVNLKVYTQGGSTETYRVFSAGDICLFNGSYEVSNTKYNEDDPTQKGEEVKTRGIDLLKYFLDAVIARAPGYQLGDSVVKKMTEVRDIYYGDPAKGGEPSYFEATTGKDTQFIRKINVDYGSTRVKIDNMDIATSVKDANGNDVPIVTYIQQPNPISASQIYWGPPSNSYFKK